MANNHGAMQVETVALAGTSAAAIAAAGGGYVATGTEEYELLAEGLARKRAGKLRRSEEGSGRCGDSRGTIGVIRMVQVNVVVAVAHPLPAAAAPDDDIDDDDDDAGGCCSGAF